MKTLHEGQKVGKLLLLKRITTKGSYTKWLCRCDCEDKTEKLIIESNLKRGLSTSCGCVAKKYKLKVGDVFSRLTIVKQHLDGRKKPWECKCSCGSGKIKSFNAYELANGLAKSCGCIKDPGDVTPGMRFGLLTAVKKLPYSISNSPGWLCQCDCGAPYITSQSKLKTRGKGRMSCGCGPRGRIAIRDELYYALLKRYKGMMERCYNPDHISYPDYGGRGITVDPALRTFEGYLANVPDGYEDGLELDRIDNDGDYTPTNLRWVTHSKNCRNRRSNRMVIDPENNELITFIDLVEKYNLKYFNAHGHLQKGRSINYIIRHCKEEEDRGN